MQTHQVKRIHKLVKSHVVGRGGKRGKTCGKGTKGQNARAGRKKRPEMRDLIKKIPKLRGYAFKRSYRDEFVTVNLGYIESVFLDGEIVNPASLLEKGLIKKSKGKNPKIKILASGNITKKITVENCRVSVEAKEKIEKAGGIVKEKAKIEVKKKVKVKKIKTEKTEVKAEEKTKAEVKEKVKNIKPANSKPLKS